MPTISSTLIPSKTSLEYHNALRRIPNQPSQSVCSSLQKIHHAIADLLFQNLRTKRKTRRYKVRFVDCEEEARVLLSPPAIAAGAYPVLGSSPHQVVPRTGGRHVIHRKPPPRYMVRQECETRDQAAICPEAALIPPSKVISIESQRSAGDYLALPPRPLRSPRRPEAVRHRSWRNAMYVSSQEHTVDISQIRSMRKGIRDESVGTARFTSLLKGWFRFLNYSRGEHTGKSDRVL